MPLRIRINAGQQVHATTICSIGLLRAGGWPNSLPCGFGLQEQAERKHNTTAKMENSLEPAMKTSMFELCAESLEAARVAAKVGADRVELCTGLAWGGITPESMLLPASLVSVGVPVHVLIRPREGNFVFSRCEFVEMQQQIEQAREAGASGVAIGVLLPDGRVDVERSRALAAFARPMAVTFHRAFDHTRDLSEALEDVIATGADSLLTSGGAADVLSGAEVIGRLLRQAEARVQIIAGGGLQLENLVQVVRRSGICSLHGSLIRRAGKPSAELNLEVLEADVREAIRLLRLESRSLQPALHAREA